MTTAPTKPAAPKMATAKPKLAPSSAAESILFGSTGVAMIITDASGLVERVNKGFERMTGYTEIEMIGEKPGAILQGPQTDSRVVKQMSEALKREEKVSVELLNYRKDETPYWVLLTIEPIFDAHGQVTHFVSFNKDITALKRSNTNLADQASDWNDSLFYARRIQTATLPDLAIIEPFVSEHFLYYQPKAVVSGDFYWAEVRDGQLFFAVADATGHGVPGAMMAMLGLSLLSQILHNSTSYSTSYLLERLHERVSKFVAGQGAMNNGVRDGMDIALIRFNPINRELQYSGAKRPIALLRSIGLEIIEPDRHSIGGNDSQVALNFTTKEFRLEAGDRVYMNTDGVTDQFGGDRKQKLTKKNFMAWLDETKDLSMADQGTEIYRRFEKWIGPHEQLDDLLYAGLKF